MLRNGFALCIQRKMHLFPAYKEAHSAGAHCHSCTQPKSLLAAKASTISSAFRKELQMAMQLCPSCSLLISIFSWLRPRRHRLLAKALFLVENLKTTHSRSHSLSDLQKEELQELLHNCITRIPFAKLLIMSDSSLAHEAWSSQKLWLCWFQGFQVVGLCFCQIGSHRRL